MPTDAARIQPSTSRGPGAGGTVSGRAVSGWEFTSLAIALAALAGRVHGAFALPPLRDFDASGHALDALALYQGALPDPGSWSGFHPPLYYALGAALWHVLPEAVPAHVGFRLVSVAALVVVVLSIWRTLLRAFPADDAAVVATALACVPAALIAGTMMSNETLCAAFLTLALARGVAATDAPRLTLRHATVTGLLIGLASLTKSTGLIGIGPAAIGYATALRRTPRQAALCALVAMAVPLALFAPHVLRLARHGDGSLLSLVSGAGGSEDVKTVMALQPPGERRLRDYWSVPWATFRRPSNTVPALQRSVVGLLHASAWADAHGRYLDSRSPAVRRAKAALSVLGVLPTLLFLAGCLLLSRRPDLIVQWIAPLAFGTALLGSFLVLTWLLPHASTVKASYLLSALLPASLPLALALDGLRGRARGLARASLLGVASVCTAATFHGWWR